MSLAFAVSRVYTIGIPAENLKLEVKMDWMVEMCKKWLKQKTYLPICTGKRSEIGLR